MKSVNFININAILSLLFAILALFAYKAYDYEQRSVHQMESYTDKLKLNPAVGTAVKYWIETGTFGIYSGYSTHIDHLEAISNKAAENHKKAMIFGGFYLLLSLLSLVLFYIFFNSKHSLRLITIILSISFLVGISAPMMEIVLFMKTPAEIIGNPNIILKYEAKGVISTIRSLFEAKNYIVIFLLGLFSLVIPVVKTISIGLIPKIEASKPRKSLEKLIHKMTRWSMADVYTVAMLIACFTFHKGEQSDAAGRIGLYFFIEYVLLSLYCNNVVIKLLK